MSRNANDLTSAANGGPMVLATVVGAIFELAVRAGVDRGPLVGRLGLKHEKELAEPERFLTLDAYIAVWEAVAELPGTETLGLELARHMRTDELGVVGWVMANAPTARDAVETVLRYSALFGDPLVPEIDYTPETMTIRRVFEPRIARTRVMTEHTPAATIVLLRDLTGMSAGEPLAMEVWFQHGPPSDPSVHERFFGCPVRFSAPETRLVLRREAVERPVLRRSEPLYEYLERHARALSESVEDRLSLSERVRRHVATTLKGGEPGPANVARIFGMSERTMQRRLKEEGRTFAEILDGVRHELASRYLGDPRLAIYEVAFLLGYAETSSFHRAFKRWTGEGPQEFRTRRCPA